MDSDDDEYEYQYDEIETETFLVDIDLSSLNGMPKPSRHRRTFKQANEKARSASNGAGLGVFNAHLQPSSSSPNGKSKRPPGDTASSQQGPVSLQILGMDTDSPIISYRDHVYTCTWTDMLGTSMYFTASKIGTGTEPSSTAKDQGFVGTSRIKLLGQRARLPTSESRKHPFGEDTDSLEVVGHGLSVVTSVARNSSPETKKQVDFLNRLTEIKRRRLEKDEQQNATGDVETGYLSIRQASRDAVSEALES